MKIFVLILQTVQAAWCGILSCSLFAIKLTCFQVSKMKIIQLSSRISHAAYKTTDFILVFTACFQIAKKKFIQIYPLAYEMTDSIFET